TQIYTLSLHDALPITFYDYNALFILYCQSVIFNQLNIKQSSASLVRWLTVTISFTAQDFDPKEYAHEWHTKNGLNRCNSLIQSRSEEHTSELQSRFDL